MLISFVHTQTCPSCGNQELGVLVAQTYVNKNSLRVTGGLGFMPAGCRKCGTQLPAEHVGEFAVAEEDRHKVNTARAKKNWPPIIDWTTYRQVAREGTR